ncbi:flavin-containing amine oxidoreductase-domain containing protein [Mycena epipterygia]|nr:flavin-containing amine oxidoreductase-domain containing protein [Mycena epipterygia]
MHPLSALLLFFTLYTEAYSTTFRQRKRSANDNSLVLILGGGASGKQQFKIPSCILNSIGIAAARSLNDQGVDFIIIEARDELGGRLQNHAFGDYTVEAGGDLIQGTQTGSGRSNPIFELAKRHNIKTQYTDYSNSLSTFDELGVAGYKDMVDRASDELNGMIAIAGPRVQQNLVDITARAGYALSGVPFPEDPHKKAAEYYEYAQKPEQVSLIKAALNFNSTFIPAQGGFSEDDLLSIDPRGFKTIIQEEAKEFILPKQVIFNSTVKTIAYSVHGVTVTLTNGTLFTGEYAICTFSLGVLQNNDVNFDPPLPDYKQEAIQSMKMASYFQVTFTKIFFQFSEKFWFDTELALYADKERGKYPIWQSLDHAKYLPGSKIIFTIVTGDFAERIEALSDSQVREEALGVLKSMYPHLKIPEPREFWFPRWRSDPLYRGSFSSWPASFVSEHYDNLAANMGNLYFAGEHTEKLYHGFLHGAYYSGLASGTVVANCVKDGGCADMPHTDLVQNTRSY